MTFGLWKQSCLRDVISQFKAQKGHWGLKVFKGVLCSFGGEIQTQNFDIYNIYEVIQ